VFVAPKFTRGEVRRAGEILAGRVAVDDPSLHVWTADVLANWRASHAYPVNTFQATLRDRLARIDHTALVAQRLKRAPSIIKKLQRFEGMQLPRMQDVGGLRAVVRTLPNVRALELAYKLSQWKHELVSTKDYIASPKTDGYRGIHLVYRYVNAAVPQYNGLLLELQIRSARQHAWATAVETASVFLGAALKTGEGDEAWLHFFALSASAIAHLEGAEPVPQFAQHSREEILQAVEFAEKQLRVIATLQGFTVAAHHIEKQQKEGSYHLITLNFDTRRVNMRAYSDDELELASRDYAIAEQRAANGEPLEVVLVSAGPLKALRRAYPNYFLDTHEFVKELHSMEQQVRRRHKE
jgi:putative GTP pyrophosphokinase